MDLRRYQYLTWSQCENRTLPVNQVPCRHQLVTQATFIICDPNADLDLEGQANTDSEMETKPNILVMLITQSA
jgi:hypothetical protein